MNASSLSDSLNELLAALGTDAAGHAVLSRGGIPLLLLTKDRSIASATLALYRPQTTKAKIAAAVVDLLCRLGLHRCTLPSIPGASDGVGVLLCNPRHGTRIVAVRRRADGRPEVVKAARRDDAAPLRREYAALTRLYGTSGVPAVGPLEERDDAVWFSIPHLGQISRHVDPLPLLRAWMTPEREPVEQNGLIRDLLPFVEGQTNRRLEGRTVRRALVHGDFAPWNWRADDNGNLVCIDWEWAREDGFAGFDLVYCLVQQALLVKRVSENRLLSVVERDVSRLSSEGQAFIQEARLPLDLLVHLVLAYRKSKRMEDGQPAVGSNAVDAHLSKSSEGAFGAQNAPHALASRFLAFEGADGAGKSTVLRLLVPELVKRGGFRGFLFFHWKPVKQNLSYDAIPEDNPHDPRGKTPRNPFASLVFLAHHWLTFQYGYWRYVRPAIRAGRLVVADRYTYDVLLDPKRFRLQLPDGILKLFVLTIPRPDHALLLYADPTVIQTRKPELPLKDISCYQRRMHSCNAIQAPIAVDADREPIAISFDIADRLESSARQ